MNINWNQLVKYVSDSKPIAIAAFVTALVLLFGNELKLTLIPKVSEEIRLYSWGVLIFSGTLILVSITPALYKFVKNTVSKVTRWYGLKNLTKLEKAILLEFVEVGPDTLYVYNLLTVYDGITSADILVATNSLKKKGLIHMSMDDRACWLINGAESVVVKLSKQRA